MLVCFLITPHGCYMNTAFMGKGCCYQHKGDGHHGPDLRFLRQISILQIGAPDSPLAGSEAPILISRFGIIEQRFAFPQRSPYPFMVPWTWVQPSWTAANEFATAVSLSLWAWIPSGIQLAFTTSLRFLDFPGHGSTVGITKDQDLCPTPDSC